MYSSSAFVAQALQNGAIGYVLDKKGYKLTESVTPIGIALLVGGVLFLLVELFIKGKTLKDEITWQIAIAVGIGQLIAMIFPGASRSGTTILFGLLLGAARPAITEFTFLVGIPTMLAASGHKVLKELHHHDAAAPPENWSMVILGTVVAAIVSFVAVKWLLRYVQSHNFNAFGYYRIVVGALILIFLRQAISSP